MTEKSSIRTTRKLNRQNAATVFWSVLLFLAFVFLLRVLLQPDPDGRFIWARAQRLEASNLIRPALRQYELLAENYGGSRYARLALQREGEILTDLARAGDTSRFAQALAIYARLAKDYPLTDGADAQLSIGEIQLGDLKNFAAARTTYENLMRDFPGNRDVVSQSMLALGQVAFAARDGKTAQKWFQKVLQTYPEQPDRCAEAQFRLGETYETLWRKKDWARDAYDATIQKYANTAWAGRARENLGLLVYGDMVPSARRVLVKMPDAVPNFASDDDDLLQALQIVLAARGLDSDATRLRGWSLQPFRAGFNPQNPARVATKTDAFANIVAIAGMTYSVEDGGDDKSARQNLQNEIDSGHLVLVFTGTWQFVAGYDSAQGQVFLQSGARLQPVALATFSKKWNRRSPLGGAFTLISFSTGADDLRAQKSSKSQPIDRILATKNGKTPANSSADDLPNTAITRTNPIPIGTKFVSSPRGLLAPTWVFSPPAIDLANAQRRAVRRAATAMRRAQSGDSLLNLAALRTLSDEMKRLSVVRIDTVISIPANENDAKNPDATPLETEPLARDSDENSTPNAAIASPSATPENALSNDATPLSPTPTATSSTRNAATPTPKATPARNSGGTKSVDSTLRVRALLAWRGAPLSNWLSARRDAAAFLQIASSDLRSSNLKSAAQAFSQAVANLESARALLDDLAALDASGGLSESGKLSANARALLTRAAQQIDAARLQESRATDAMSQL